METPTSHPIIPTEQHPQEWLLVARTVAYRVGTRPNRTQVWNDHHLEKCIADYIAPIGDDHRLGKNQNYIARLKMLRRMAGADDNPTAIDVAELEGNAWSVARLNEEIESVLQNAGDRFPTYVFGEISEVSSYGFGTFFELRDLEEDAVIACLAWSYAVDDFDHDLEDGTAAIVRTSVDFYPERGDTQLVVSDYWPVGDSDRTQALEALRSQLNKEGLLDDDRKRSLPQYPTHVGVVTSLSGSAREDFTSSVRDRSPGVMITFCGANVQGDNAVPSIVGAIQTLERDHPIDVLVVTRGGGSDTDLWCFNEEPVVRAIADCSTPVVVAVGHEDDETLSEAVADYRAMTPTDAGVAVTPNIDSIKEATGQLEHRLDMAYTALIEDQLDEYDRRIEAAEKALEQQIAARNATHQRAADLEQRISRAYTDFVADRLDSIGQRLETGMRNLEHAAETDAVTARAARGRIDDLEARIDRAYRSRVERELYGIESRIGAAYRDVETEAKIEAGTVEARRLRIVVAVLVALLLLGTAVVIVLLL